MITKPLYLHGSWCFLSALMSHWILTTSVRTAGNVICFTDENIEFRDSLLLVLGQEILNSEAQTRTWVSWTQGFSHFMIPEQHFPSLPHGLVVLTLFCNLESLGALKTPDAQTTPYTKSLPGGQTPTPLVLEIPRWFHCGPKIVNRWFWFSWLKVKAEAIDIYVCDLFCGVTGALCAR